MTAAPPGTIDRLFSKPILRHNMKASNDSSSKMSRADFLRVSSLGLGGIFMGFNPLSLNAANDKGPSGPDRKELFESWHSPWQPQLPSRLSKITHELAWKGLSGETGSTMKKDTSR